MKKRRATAPRSRKAGSAHRYPGASTNPLTSKQKGIVVMLAQRAFAHQRAGGDFNAWRREQQERAVGQDSLTICCQADYNMLVSHFEGLAGDAVKEFASALRDTDERKRQARHAVEDALNDAELPLAYAEKICRTQYRRGLDDATPEQLWRIKYTVTTRSKILRGEPVDLGDPF